VNEVKGILLRLKNSLGNLTEERIRKAEKALNEFAEEMESKGYWFQGSSKGIRRTFFSLPTKGLKE